MRLAASLLIAILAAISAACSPRISEADLAKRIEQAEVRWNNYQEDIKAQIGAAPAAEWEGRPVSAQRDGSSIVIAFDVDGPWAARDSGIPVLIRDPLGNVVREAETTATADHVGYAFTIDESWVASPVPWVELQFPGNETRVVFREDGTWQSHR